MAATEDTVKHNKTLSKALSWLLRHHLDLVSEISKEPIDPSGFVDVEHVLQLPRFAGYTMAQVEQVVKLNDKQRFSLRSSPTTEGRLQIRANQGHTMKEIEPDLKKMEEPFAVETIVHGTYEKFWPSIEKTGLSRMKRNHIHFAKGLPGESGVISGMRHDCNVHIFVHMPTAIQAGFEFFQSANGVILCPGDENGRLPATLFAKVIRKKEPRKKKETKVKDQT